jgi:hypothetical protein
MNLLIHADPGARSGFIAAWLTNQLTKVAFDSGVSLRPRFVKIHKLEDVDILKNFSGTKIRVRPSVETIDIHSLLFLRKNVHVQHTNFTRDEYSLETFTKLTHFSQEILEWNNKLDYSLYDIVIDFADTFNKDFMIDLYKKIVGTMPSSHMIDMLDDTNNLNNITIDKNHACSILKLCLLQEQKLELKEENRFWSVIDVYNTTSVDQLYDTVYNLIDPKNYGIYLKNL